MYTNTALCHCAKHVSSLSTHRYEALSHLDSMDATMANSSGKSLVSP